MLLLIVLLAQAVPPSDEPPLVPSGDIAGLQNWWQQLDTACRRLPHDSVEGQNACYGRDVIRVQLGRQGWCLRQSGIRFEWDMCPRR